MADVTTRLQWCFSEQRGGYIYIYAGMAIVRRPTSASAFYTDQSLGVGYSRLNKNGGIGSTEMGASFSH
jgi:hypothetical protein